MKVGDILIYNYDNRYYRRSLEFTKNKEYPILKEKLKWRNTDPFFVITDDFGQEQDFLEGSVFAGYFKLKEFEPDDNSQFEDDFED